MKEKTILTMLLLGLVLVSAVAVFAKAIKPQLWVKSKPGNSSVLWDGNYVGDTPAKGWLRLGNATIGTHNISIVKAGYEDWTRLVNINNTKRYKINAKLIGINSWQGKGVPKTGFAMYQNNTNRTDYQNNTNKTGNIKVVTNPSGASVNLDGIFRGITGGRRQGILKIKKVNIGRHSLDVSLNETYFWNGTIKVKADKTIKVKLDFTNTTNSTGW